MLKTLRSTPSTLVSNANQARTRAQSWSYEAYDESKSKADVRKAAASLPDYSSYCPRCGLPENLSGPPKEAESKKDEVEGEDKKSGDHDEDTAVPAITVTDTTTETGGVKEHVGKDKQGDEDAKETKRVCDRCGCVGGATCRFWPFHELHPAGKPEGEEGKKEDAEDAGESEEGKKDDIGEDKGGEKPGEGATN